MSSYVVKDSIQFQHVSRNLNPYSPLLVPGSGRLIWYSLFYFRGRILKSLSPSFILVSQLSFNLTMLGSIRRDIFLANFK